MADEDARSIIEPELQIALAKMAERFKRSQDHLPLWVYELLEQFGEACAARAIRWMHERPTQRPSSPEIEVGWEDEETPRVDPWKE